MILQADARHIPLKDHSVDAVLSSPPYNANKPYPNDVWTTWEEYYGFLDACYSECRRVARGPVVWILPMMIRHRAVAFWPKYPWIWACPVIRGSEAAMWAAAAGKWNGTPFYIGSEVLVADRSPWNQGHASSRPSVFFIPQPWIGSSLRNRPKHPAPFPEEYVQAFLRLWPSTRSLLDPFGGTGTVAKAGRRLGV